MRYREAMSSVMKCRQILQSESATVREREFADGVAGSICFDFRRYPTAAQEHWTNRIFEQVLAREKNVAKPTNCDQGLMNSFQAAS